MFVVYYNLISLSISHPISKNIQHLTNKGTTVVGDNKWLGVPAFAADQPFTISQITTRLRLKIKM